MATYTVIASMGSAVHPLQTVHVVDVVYLHKFVYFLYRSNTDFNA